MKKEVKEALSSILNEKDIRSIKLGINTQTIFKAKYLFVKVISVSHPGENFTPDGDTFLYEDFEIISGVNFNGSDKALNLPSNGYRIMIFTDQKKGPTGTTYVKDIAAYKENLVEAVKAYNKQFSGEYNAAEELSEEEELID